MPKHSPAKKPHQKGAFLPLLGMAAASLLPSLIGAFTKQGSGMKKKGKKGGKKK